MNRRSFLTGAPLLALPGVVVAQVTKQSPQIIGEVKPGGEWPLKQLEIEGKDGQKHLVPAWK